MLGSRTHAGGEPTMSIKSFLSIFFDCDVPVSRIAAGALVVAWGLAAGFAPTASAAEPRLAWTNEQTLNSNAFVDVKTDDEVTVATDGGTWIAAWSSQDGSGGGGEDRDILYRISVDQGQTWGAESYLNSNALTDASGPAGAHDSRPSLATDGDGNWIAVWDSTSQQEFTIGEDRDILYATSSDNGATWGAVQALNSNADTDNAIEHDIAPRVATDLNGTWLVVWSSGADFGGIGPDIDVLYSISSDNGGTWSVAAPLNSNATSDSGSDTEPVHSFADGNWVAAWTSGDDLGGTIGTDDDIVYAVSNDDGLSWSAPSALNSNAASDTGDDNGQDLATSGSGEWIATWNSDDTLGGTIGDDADILAAVSNDNGVSWSQASSLNSGADTDSANDLWPRISTDAAGLWMVVWYSRNDLDGTIGGDEDILYAYSLNVGATWSSADALGTVAAGDTGTDAYPALVANGAGNWLAAWRYSGDFLGDPLGADGDLRSATVFVGCGDGLLLGDEVCDDGNTEDGDCCSAKCDSLTVPTESCLTDWGKGKLTVKDSGPDGKLFFAMGRGPAFPISKFGNPATGTTAYTTCIMNDARNPVAILQVSRGGQSCGRRSCWRATRPGFSYSDRAASADGMKKMKLIAKEVPGRSVIKGVAVNNARREQDSMPVGIPDALLQSTDATVRVYQNDPPLTSAKICWEVTLDQVTKQTSDLFKAKK